jgi:hypothetical protein
MAGERNLDMVVERRMIPEVVAGTIAGFVALVAAGTVGVNAATSTPRILQAAAISPNSIPIDPR